MILTFNGEASELRLLLRELFSPIMIGKVHNPPGDPLPGDVEWTTDLGGDTYLALANAKQQLAETEEKRVALQQEVDILEARAAAARPLAEAQAVIDKATELWLQLNAATDAFLAPLVSQSPAFETVAGLDKLHNELRRSLRALGDQLGEEGGEDLDPPC